MNSDGNPTHDVPPSRDPRRLQAGDGTNPFRDDVVPPAPALDPFAPPSGESSLSAAGQYEAVLPHRGLAVLMLGIGGFLGVTVGSVGLMCCLPFPLFALAISVPAWLMGRMDLKAMDAGAMDNSGRGQTTAGYWLGLIASIMSVLICGGIAVWIFSQAVLVRS